MTHPASAPGQRRAPRLTPEQHIGAHITRRGRFLALDPAQARPLPGVARTLGAFGWAGLLGYAFARAVREGGKGAPPDPTL